MKLTENEAQLVLNEAYRLKAEYAHAKSRLGQSIYWATTDSSLLEARIVYKLQKLLDYKELEGIDFFYWTDDNEVINTFYEHFVEKGE